MDNLHPAAISAAPYLADPTPYPVMIRDGGETVLVHRRYVDMTRHFLRTWAKTTWRLGWRCYFTGVHLYGFDRRAVRHSSEIPWALSMDHLVPQRHKKFLEPEYSQPISESKVIVGMHLNRALGHDPLVVKIMIRRHLLALDLDREHPTMDDHEACFQSILAAKEMMMANGGFVWQETNFTDPALIRRAQLCFGEMLDVEREFLKLPKEERQDWIDAFEWKW